MKALRHGIVLCTAAVALAACATEPRSTDVVRDAATAIAIAKKECDAAADSHWDARFFMGLWDVTQKPGPLDRCKVSLEVEIFPDTGKTRGCMECAVVVT